MSKNNQFFVVVLITVNIATMFTLFKLGGIKSHRQMQTFKIKSVKKTKGFEAQVAQLKKELISSNFFLTSLAKNTKTVVHANEGGSKHLKPLVDQLFDAFGEMLMIERYAEMDATDNGIELSEDELNALTEDIGGSAAYQVYSDGTRALVIEYLNGQWQISLVIAGAKSQPIVYNTELGPCYKTLGGAEGVSVMDLNNDGIGDFIINVEFPFQNGEFKDGTLLVISNGSKGAYLVNYEYRGASFDSFEQTSTGCLLRIPVYVGCGYASNSKYVDVVTYELPIDNGKVMSFSPKEVTYHRIIYVKNGKTKEDNLPLPSLEEQKKNYPPFKVNIFKFKE